MNYAFLKPGHGDARNETRRSHRATGQSSGTVERRSGWAAWESQVSRSRTLSPLHPGEILREEFLRPLGISINALARELNVPVSRISKIVNEERGISAETAIRLARYFRMSSEFWMNLQSRYDLQTAQGT